MKVIFLDVDGVLNADDDWFTSPDLKKENGKPVVLMYRPDILNVIWVSAIQKFKD